MFKPIRDGGWVIVPRAILAVLADRGARDYWYLDFTDQHMGGQELAIITQGDR